MHGKPVHAVTVWMGNVIITDCRACRLGHHCVDQFRRQNQGVKFQMDPLVKAVAHSVPDTSSAAFTDTSSAAFTASVGTACVHILIVHAQMPLFIHMAAGI